MSGVSLVEIGKIVVSEFTPLYIGVFMAPPNQLIVGRLHNVSNSSNSILIDGLGINDIDTKNDVLVLKNPGQYFGTKLRFGWSSIPEAMSKNQEFSFYVRQGNKVIVELNVADEILNEGSYGFFYFTFANS